MSSRGYNDTEGKMKSYIQPLIKHTPSAKSKLLSVWPHLSTETKIGGVITTAEDCSVVRNNEIERNREIKLVNFRKGNCQGILNSSKMCYPVEAFAERLNIMSPTVGQNYPVWPH